MLRLLLITTTLFLCSCSKPSLAPKLECWDREYVVDDLGKSVSISDFDIDFDCDYGNIHIIDAHSSTLLFLENQLIPDFEMELGFFPNEFEIIFKSGDYWFRVLVVVDDDRRSTMIHEVSNYCGGGCG